MAAPILRGYGRGMEQGIDHDRIWTAALIVIGDVVRFARVAIETPKAKAA